MTNPALTIAEWLKRIEYKPDTEFEVRDYAGGLLDRGGYLTIYVVRRLPDSTRAYRNVWEYYHPDALIRVVATIPCDVGRFQYVPTDQAFDVFVRWFRDELFRLERHEVDEWFRVDEVLPFDPHR